MSGVPEVRKTVTVLFTDVTGSTSLGESLDPESLRHLMARYFDEMSRVIDRHGGLVEKFIGDAVMAVFGIPRVREDDALRAVRAATEMRDRLATLNEEFERDQGVVIQVRTGVNTGEVVAGASGADFLATGDPVNVAARLEQGASPGEILIGHSTYRLVKDAVVAEEMEPLELKGKADRVRAWRLREVAVETSGVARRLVSPIVGRERELRLLIEALERATTERSCRLVTVVGDAGVGKSRLTEGFIAGLGDRTSVARGRCLPYGEGITFWPVGELVKRVSGIDEGDPAPDPVAAIERCMPADPDAATVAHHVAAAVGLAAAAYSVQETFWAIRRFLELVSSRRPLVAVFDDIHWAEETFLDLLEYLSGWSTGFPILLLCLARPDLLDARPAWGAGKDNVESIRLEPLTDEGCGHVIRNLLEGAELDPELVTHITEVCEGNPLFIEEIFRMLVDEGVLRRDDGSWRADTDLSSLSIPPSIHALLDARLEQLPGDERAVLQRASVIGKAFWWGAVSELSPEEERPFVGTLLQALARRDLIHPDQATFAGEDGFRFGHILVRDAAYRAIPKGTRADLHRRLAGWLESKAGDRIGEYEEIIGYHQEQSYLYRAELGPVGVEDRRLASQAASRLASAGWRAFARSDNPATVNLFSRAEVLLPPDDPLRLRILPDLGAALLDAGEPERARAAFDEGVERAVSLGDEALGAHTTLQRWLWLGEGDLSEATTAANHALEVFEAVGDQVGISRAWRALGHVAWREGRVQAEEQAIAHALQHARNAADAREQAEIFLTLSRDLVRGPTPVLEGIQRCESVLAEWGGNRDITGWMWHALAHLRARRGEFVEALALAERFRTILLENGQLEAYWFFVEVVGDVRLIAGQVDEATQILTDGFNAMVEPDPLIGVLLGQALYEAGRFEEAGAKAEPATASDLPLASNLARGLLAKVRARQGRSDEAQRLAREAVAAFEESEFLIDLATVLMDSAEAAYLGGRLEDAVDDARRAIDAWARKGDVVSAARGERSLAEFRRGVGSEG